MCLYSLQWRKSYIIPINKHSLMISLGADFFPTLNLSTVSRTQFGKITWLIGVI